jgi:hypothetical protein
VQDALNPPDERAIESSSTEQTILEPPEATTTILSS